MVQHLVSRVVLRQWANWKNGPIGGLDMRSLEQRTDQVEKFAGLDDPGLNAPDATEKIWSDEVEVRLPHAFARLKAGELLSDRAAMTTVKNCIALHWARGFVLTELTQQIIPLKVEEITASLTEQFSPQQIMSALTGVSLVSPDMSALLKQRISADFTKKLENERFMDEQFVVQYVKCKELISSHSLEIWHSNTDDFLIGDAPVVSYNKEDDKVGVLSGVSWDKADAIFMPLGPHHVVALAKTNTEREASPANVEQFNAMQVRGALREVFFRPDGGLGDIIANAIKKNEAKANYIS